MLKRAVLMTCVTALALAAPALAQQSATVVLRSGERVSGDLVDHGNAGFIVRVNGQQRTIATGDVAAVEFSGGRDLNSDMTAKLNAGQQFIILSNGQIVEGRLYDIGGTRPLRITLDTSSGRHDYNSNEVAAIYIAPATSGAVATSGTQSTAAVPGAIVVPGNTQWTPTAITVRNRETLRFQSSGEVHFTPGDRAHAAGSFDQKFVPNAPLPNAYAGALIGKIGPKGAPFAIGDQTAIRMPAGGQLFLGINDDTFSDNSGAFQVVVAR